MSRELSDHRSANYAGRGDPPKMEKGEISIPTIESINIINIIISNLIHLSKWDKNFVFINLWSWEMKTIFNNKLFLLSI